MDSRYALTVSRPFFPQLLSDSLLLLADCTFRTLGSEFGRSSSVVCKTTAGLQTVDMKKLRAEWGSQTGQFLLPQAAEAPQRETGQCHSILVRLESKRDSETHGRQIRASIWKLR